MNDDTFDVIVVGARIAGAALAQRLAGNGLTVALLDAAPLPSGQPMSTHLIQPPGMDELDALHSLGVGVGVGVGEQVRALSPTLHSVRMAFDGREIVFPYGPGRAAHCLRRTELDRLLQDAAVQAGAHLMPETRVVDVFPGGVVTRDRRLHAPLVVGADGRNSTVAKLVGAQEYLAYDAPRGCYWAYWRRPPRWDPHTVYNSFDGDDSRVVFPTDGDLLLIATAPPVERARAWRDDHAAAYLANIRSHEPIASFLADDRPVSEVRGITRCRYFFRVAAGPGWALVGDAGHHKEFIVGLGITDALRDARNLADVIVGGREPEQYWRQRDAARIELYEWSRDLGAAGPVDPLERLVAQRAPHHPDVLGRFGKVIDGELSPSALVPPALAARWVMAEVLRGRTGALRPFLRTARSEIQRRRRRIDARPGDGLGLGANEKLPRALGDLGGQLGHRGTEVGVGNHAADNP
jgi:flavin-dependent dehydrogenase